jgi:hypothetical protein
MKSTAGFVLGLIGGIIAGLVGLWTFFVAGAMGSFLSLILGPIAFLGIFFPVIILVGAGLAIWGAILMNNESDNTKVKKGGILTLVGGVLSFNIFSIIGGILGMVASGKTA